MKLEVKKNITIIFLIFSSLKEDYCKDLFTSYEFIDLLKRMLVVKNYDIL